MARIIIEIKEASTFFEIIRMQEAGITLEQMSEAFKKKVMFRCGVWVDPKDTEQHKMVAKVFYDVVMYDALNFVRSRIGQEPNFDQLMAAV